MTKNILTMVVCAMLLSGCSWFDEWSPWSSEQSGLEPPSSLMVARAPYEKINKEDIVPSTHEPALNNENEEVDIMVRVEKLEFALEKMRSSMENMMPALTRLAGIETELRSVLSGMSPSAGGFNNVDSMASIAPRAGGADVVDQETLAALRMEKRAEDMKKMMEQEASGGDISPILRTERTAKSAGFYRNVKNVRVGVHTDKTRLVLDVDGEPDFNYTMNDTGDVLAIDLKNMGWQAGSALTGTRSSLISSYSVQNMGDKGTRLLIKLKRPSTILWANKLGPNSKHGHRIVIDLSGA